MEEKKCLNEKNLCHAILEISEKLNQYECHDVERIVAAYFVSQGRTVLFYDTHDLTAAIILMARGK